MGASGAISLFGKFRDQAVDIVREFSDTHNLNNFIKNIECIVKKINREYEYAIHGRNFDLLVAIRNTSSSVKLQYICTDGVAEDVSNFRATGLGEPYGSILLKQLWHQNLTMLEAAELGYRIIKYIEKF
jgi:hypothetical protein